MQSNPPLELKFSLLFRKHRPCGSECSGPESAYSACLYGTLSSCSMLLVSRTAGINIGKRLPRSMAPIQLEPPHLIGPIIVWVGDHRWRKHFHVCIFFTFATSGVQSMSVLLRLWLRLGKVSPVQYWNLLKVLLSCLHSRIPFYLNAHGLLRVMLSPIDCWHDKDLEWASIFAYVWYLVQDLLYLADIFACCLVYSTLLPETDNVFKASWFRPFLLPLMISQCFLTELCAVFLMKCARAVRPK